MCVIFDSLRDFMAHLESKGRLVRVAEPVSPILEITEIHTRLLAERGPAVLFERVEGFGIPVLTNLFGTARRAEIAFGERPLRLIKRIVHLALRWILDQQGEGFALWGARKPEQLDPLDQVYSWRLDASAMTEIDRILAATIESPIGPEFMAPPVKAAA